MQYFGWIVCKSPSCAVRLMCFDKICQCARRYIWHKCVLCVLMDVFLLFSMLYILCLFGVHTLRLLLLNRSKCNMNCRTRSRSSGSSRKGKQSTSSSRQRRRRRIHRYNYNKNTLHSGFSGAYRVRSPLGAHELLVQTHTAP